MEQRQQPFKDNHPIICAHDRPVFVWTAANGRQLRSFVRLCVWSRIVYRFSAIQKAMQTRVPEANSVRLHGIATFSSSCDIRGTHCYLLWLPHQ